MASQQKTITEFERLRVANGYTQKTLAEAVGVDQSTVSRWETGEYFPEPKYIPLLAKKLKVTGKEITYLCQPATS